MSRLNLTPGQWLIVVFNALYLLAFSAYYLTIRNFEFLWYVVVIVFFLVLIVLTLKRTRFDGVILGGLSLWGFLHMAGGGVRVGESVLYRLPLIHLFGEGDSLVFKFDQLVHLFGFGVATILFYHLLRPYLQPKANWIVVYPLIILGGMGIGALNEIIEFIAVVAIGSTGVGGYWNTALDLVFNTLGAIAAAVFIHFYYRPRQSLL